MKCFVPVEAAMKVLDWDGDDVHVFDGAYFGALVGADWSRKDVEMCFSRHRPELAGPSAKSLNHGISAAGRFFFATKEHALELLELESSPSRNGDAEWGKWRELMAPKPSGLRWKYSPEVGWFSETQGGAHG